MAALFVSVCLHETCAVRTSHLYTLISSSPHVGGGGAGGAGVPSQWHAPAAAKDQTAANGVGSLDAAFSANGAGNARALNRGHGAPDTGCERGVGRLKDVLYACVGLFALWKGLPSRTVSTSY